MEGNHVGRDRGDDDQVDLRGADASTLQAFEGGGGGEFRCSNTFGRVMARGDAGARANPLVVRVNELLEVPVVENLWR